MHSPGITTSQRTGSTLSANRSDTKVEMMEVFPTAARHYRDASVPTIANDNDSNSIILHSGTARARARWRGRVKQRVGYRTCYHNSKKERMNDRLLPYSSSWHTTSSPGPKMYFWGLCDPHDLSKIFTMSSRVISSMLSARISAW